MAPLQPLQPVQPLPLCLAAVEINFNVRPYVLESELVLFVVEMFCLIAKIFQQIKFDAGPLSHAGAGDINIFEV